MTSDRGAYRELRSRMPELFDNPPDAGFEILHDPALVAAAEQAKAESLRSRDLPESWSSTGVVYQDEYLLVVRDAVRFPSGTLGTYVREIPASGSHGVVMLPVIDGQVVLIEHFRHATRRWHLEAPRGFGEAGVPSKEQARRELRDEIGTEPERLTDLGLLHPDSGMAADRVHLFYAEIGQLGPLGTDEAIRAVRTYPVRRVGELIRDAVITDSFTIAAYTRALLRGLLGPVPR